MFINSPAKSTKAFMGNCRDVLLSSMGDCEICGAMKVKTSAVFMGKAEVGLVPGVLKNWECRRKVLHPVLRRHLM